MRDFYRISTLGVIALVALRVGIGWHFFKEGSDKIKTGTFSSEGFLKSSEGRLSGLFQGLVWDADGNIRLDGELTSTRKDGKEVYELKSDVLLPHFKQSVEEAKKKFVLSEQQTRQLDSLWAQFCENLTDVHLQYSAEIDKFRKSAPRIAKMQDSPVWDEITSLRGHQQKIEKERLAEVWPAVESIEALTKRFEQQVNALISGDSNELGSRFRLRRPEDSLISSQAIDRILPVFDFTIGILLIIGLLVPLASWLGAGFLLGVILSQFPGDPGTQPTYFQSVEALSLVLLGSIGAGRFAGLDFFIWSIKQNRKAARIESPSKRD